MADWDARYMRLVEEIRSWSKDPSTKTAAIIVNDRNRIVSTGYNGFAPGADDSPHLYADRKYKYLHVIHAEINAIREAEEQGKSANNCRIYCSLYPCIDCARKLVVSGIKEIICPDFRNDEAFERWKDSFAKTNTLLEAMDISQRFI